MFLEPWGPPALGLRHHVRQVADLLGCTGDAFCLQTEEPFSAYLPLEQRFYGFPDHDAALLWNADHGWAAAVGDTDPLIIGYLGEDLLPPPQKVAKFVASLVAGQPIGRLDPPNFASAANFLSARLAAQAPALEAVG
jgi:hypothetical protein